ncbi:MAG: adenine deaminase [Selenomonadaceae bacterium]|nr:adenine deaminase [Selenomonadaceae bacterium]
MLDRKKLVQVALGNEPADLVLKNAEVFHVFTGEFLNADVAIVDGYIAGVGENYTGITEIDLSGKFLLPGYIDSHINLESSTLLPDEFARAAISNGTTTVIMDPHEIANVCGTAGIRFMLEATERIPLNVYMTLPSCVPASRLDTSGAILEADDLKPILSHPRVLGLGEMMDFHGVLNLNEGVYAKLSMADNILVEGHAPGLKDKTLMAYAAAGIRSDHECTTPEQALQRLRAGMHLHLREGAVSKNFMALSEVINQDTAPYISFCADDISAEELLKEGHINKIVRMAISRKVPVATVLQIATINTAKYYGLKDVGAIAPGYKADILVMDSQNVRMPRQVYKSGQLVCTDGVVVDIPKTVIPPEVMNTINIKGIRKEDLKIPMKGNMANVIGIVPYQVVTKHFKLQVAVKNGEVISDIENDILKLAVFERHHGTGNVGLGLVKGLGLKSGAIASSIAHDSHNIIVAGTNDTDMILAVEEISRIGGGIVIVENGSILSCFPLPIAGLMTDLPAQEVADKQAELREIAHSLGVYSFINPFLTLSFCSLPVIPALKLTDQGLVLVETGKYIPVECFEA